MGVWSPGPGATAGNDTFTGDATNESANGGLGDDNLIGNGGNDQLTGGGGADVVDGGDGDDSLNGGTSSVSNPQGGVIDGVDIINGGAGNDVLRGQDGDDQLTGGIGSDNLRGDLGNDVLNGGDGEDLVSFRFDDLGLVSGVVFSAAGYTNGGAFSDGRGGVDTLISIERIILTGTTFNDQLTGSDGRDQISTIGGNDIANGGLGDDTIFDFNGNSSLNGGGGNDRITIDASNNTFSAFLGGVDTVDGGVGTDTVYLSWNLATVGITATLTGTTLDARTGDNAIIATGTNIEQIEVDGSSVNDSLTGGAGDDGFFGFDGDDTLNGGDGNDVLWGGAGDDVLTGGAGIDRYISNDYSQSAFDVRTLDFSAFNVSGATFVIVDFAGDNDTLTGIDGVQAFGGNVNDTIIGSAGADSFNGGFGTDTIDGGNGDDLIIGTQFSLGGFFNQPGVGQVFVTDGNDTFIGGLGNDTLSYLGNSSSVTINASTGTATSAVSATDSFSGFENYIGGAVDDQFIGSTNAESFDGGYGNDTAFGDAGADTLNGGAGDDTLDGGADNDTLNGGGGFDEISGGDGDDVISIVGYETDLGGDIDGGLGADEIVALGDTALDVHVIASIERLRFADNGVYNYVTMAASQVGNGFSSTLNVVGTAAADEIDIYLGAGQTLDISGWTFTTWSPLLRQVGDPTADFIYIFASSGAETVTGSTASDTVFAGAGNDLVFGGDGSDNLRGEAGDDILNGGNGDDLMRGGAGIDNYIGGDGLDRVSFYDLTATQGVVASLLTQTISNDGFGNVETMSGIEDLGAGTAFADSFEGTNGANLMLLDNGDTGLALGGDDSFQIDRAPLLVDGGDGNDTILSFTLSSLRPDTNGDGRSEVIQGTTGVIVDLGNNQILNDGFGNGGVINSIENAGGSALNDQITGSDVANILNGFVGNDVLLGLGGSDTLDGAEGDDTLDGGADIDSMTGGAGNDLYAVDSLGETVIELADGGIDTVQSAVSYTLGDNVENLYLSGAATLGYGNALTNSIFGNALNNTLYGYAGDDGLTGGDGADQLFGGLGADQLFGDLGDDTLDGDTESDFLSGGEGLDTLYGRAGDDTLAGGAGADSAFGGDGADDLLGEAGADVLDGGNDNDTLNGGDDNDTLYGRAGNDIVDGGAGADSMFGGAGDDEFYVDNAGDAVGETSGAGTDTVFSTVTYSLSAFVENLNLLGSNNLQGVGNSLANEITGNSGANSLSGLAGFDTLFGLGGVDLLFGGAGNDTLYGGNDNDQLDGGNDVDLLDGGAGNDTLFGRAGADTAFGGADADNVYGGDGDDTLNGDAGDDLLDGGNQNDTLNGGDGADTLYGRQNNDTLRGQVGADTLFGGDGNDNLDGGDDNDTVDGGNGLDTLDGGLGADTLNGGAGADSFVFSTALGGGNIDVIVGYSVVDDTITLDVDIFTGIGLGALGANAFVIGAAAADGDDRIIYNPATGQLFYDADGNGAGAAVQFATLGTGLALTSADFVGGP